MTTPYFDNDEAILAMDVEKCDHAHLTPDELKVLADAGIKTSLLFDASSWQEAEPRPGVYDWRALDKRVEETNAAGMKAIIKFPRLTPAWMPDNWMAHASGGAIRGVLSPWSQAAQDYEFAMIRRVCARYNDAQLGNLVVSTTCIDGETPFFTAPFWYSADALADFRAYAGADAVPYYPDPNGRIPEPTLGWLKQTCINMLKRQAEVYIDNPWSTLFAAFHPSFDGTLRWDCCGCQWIDDIMAMYNGLAEDAQVCQIFYEWIAFQHYFNQFAITRNKYHTLQFGGANFTKGLRGEGSTRMAIEQGMRGQILGPTHAFTGLTEIAPDMLAEIAWAAGEWRNYLNQKSPA